MKKKAHSNSKKTKDIILEEGKRRMGTSNNYTPEGIGMTGLTSNINPDDKISSYTSNLQNTSMSNKLNTASSYSSVPSLNSAMGIKSELERDKQKVH